MKNKIYKQLTSYHNELISLKIYVSFLSVLESAYETASQKKQYTKAHYINILIGEEINADFY